MQKEAGIAIEEEYGIPQAVSAPVIEWAVGKRSSPPSQQEMVGIGRTLLKGELNQVQGKFVH